MKTGSEVWGGWVLMLRRALRVRVALLAHRSMIVNGSRLNHA